MANKTIKGKKALARHTRRVKKAYRKFVKLANKKIRGGDFPKTVQDIENLKQRYKQEYNKEYNKEYQNSLSGLVNKLAVLKKEMQELQDQYIVQESLTLKDRISDTDLRIVAIESIIKDRGGM